MLNYSFNELIDLTVKVFCIFNVLDILCMR